MSYDRTQAITWMLHIENVNDDKVQRQGLTHNCTGLHTHALAYLPKLLFMRINLFLLSQILKVTQLCKSWVAEYTFLGGLLFFPEKTLYYLRKLTNFSNDFSNFRGCIPSNPAHPPCLWAYGTNAIWFCTCIEKWVFSCKQNSHKAGNKVSNTANASFKAPSANKRFCAIWDYDGLYFIRKYVILWGHQGHCYKQKCQSTCNCRVIPPLYSYSCHCIPNKSLARHLRDTS